VDCADIDEAIFLQMERALGAEDFEDGSVGRSREISPLRTASTAR
jgi:hypothetical protein